MAEQLNNYFSSAFTEEDKTNFPEMLRNQGPSKEELKEIIIRKIVLETVMGLKANKSSNPDDLHPRVLKELDMEKWMHLLSPSKILQILELFWQIEGWQI